MTMKRVRTILAALCATAFMASPGIAQNPIKIGFPMVQSGPASLVGVPTTAGAQMAIDEINARGGVLGRKLELIIRDTKGTADEAVRVSRELILRDNVDFLVGTSTSAEGPAVSTIAKENKIVLLAAIPGVDSLTAPQNLHPYIFRTSIPTKVEGRAAAEVFAKWTGVKKVATISPDYGYGQDLTREFIAHLKKLRPDIEIVDQQWPKFGEREFSPFINAQMAKQPDAVFASVWGGDFVTFAKQAKRLGYFDAIKNNFIAVGGGASVENTRAMNEDYPIGIWGNAFDVLKWDAGTAAHADWMTRLKKHTKDEYPSSWPTMGYIPIIFLAEAIKKAGSVDSDKVSAALRGLTVDTPIGKLTMRAKDHEVGRGNFWGKVDKVAGVPFPIMTAPTYIDPAPFMD
jgi:branched-chain amino acid transport system substrate-binding protein